MDELRKGTDKKLKEIEDKLESVYKDAEGELRDKWDTYMQRAEKRVERYEKALQDAMTTGDADKIAAARAELQKKIQSVTLRDKQFSEMVDSVTDRLANANKIAVDYVNGQMPGIYRYNYNGVLREAQDAAESGGISGIAFNMVDEATVKKLVKDGEIKLPKKKIDIPKDKQWNKKAIASQMMQGIVQGESIPQMSKRLQAVTDMDKNAAIRNARTMTTEAENGGRLDSMEEAEQLGLEYEKTWMATHDERTRESHARIDGETVPVDEPFSNGLMFPGDPSGAPEEVYNCRCSLVRKLVGFKGKHIETKGYKPTYFDDVKEEAAEQETTRGSYRIELPEAVEENYNDFIEKHVSSKTEYTMTCDENGNIMYEGGGKKTSVSTPRYIAEQSEGCYHIHNHPLPEIFSPQDVHYMEEYKLKNSSIVTSAGIQYSLEIVDKKASSAFDLSAAYGEAYKKTADTIIDEMREKQKELVEAGLDRNEISRTMQAWRKENSTTERMTVWLEENAPEYGFAFERKRVK